jgi:hypothetical protein
MRIVDLTHSFDDDTPMLPGMATLSFVYIARWETMRALSWVGVTGSQPAERWQ